MTELHDVDGVIDGHADATHHTLVIAEEEDGQATQAINSDEQRALLVVVDHIKLRDAIHR